MTGTVSKYIKFDRRRRVRVSTALKYINLKEGAGE